MGGWKIFLGCFLRTKKMKMPIWGGPKHVQNGVGTPGGLQEALESALASILDRFGKVWGSIFEEFWDAFAALLLLVVLRLCL